MKTKIVGLLVGIILTTISCTAQQRVTVEAVSNDISNNLDLQAVASIFGESTDLEDFERRLNDYDSQISNLDLNNDGEVDYLRVIENMENNVHVVVVQAVLGRDIYQDVATIIVDRQDNRRTHVQVIGDSYLYGDDYVIEPVYVYTPSIFSFLWGYNYHSWYSPYYYGYYPRYYHSRNPFEVNIYLNRVHSHINYDHRYFYSNHHRNEYADRLYKSMSRNDYQSRYPDRKFSSRNSNVSNKKAFDNVRSNNTVHERRSNSSRSERTFDNNSGTFNSGNGSRDTERRNSNTNVNQRSNSPSTENRNSRVNRSLDDVYQNRSTRNDIQNQNNRQNNISSPERNANSRTYTQPTPQRTQTIEINRNQGARSSDNNYQRPNTNTNTNTNVPARPQQPSVTRDNSPRQAPVVSQPSRQAESRPAATRQAESTPSRDTRNDRDSRSNDNSGRR
jgi:hypothetical protein